MGLRELLILILILAIVGVILRGLYVALRARRGQLRMQLDKNIPQYDPEELVRSELPNGGARMVERSFAQVLQQNSEFSANDRRKTGKSEHAIPVLMDSIGEDDEEEELSAPRQSSVASARDAARQKHRLGQRNAPVVQKPVHRPIDRIAAAALNNPTSTSAPITPQDSRETEHESDEDFYDDPLDNHVFSEPEDETPEQASAYQDSDDFDDDDDADADDFDDSDDFDDDDELDEAPSEQSVDPDDDFEDDFEDEEELEDNDDDEDFDDELEDDEDSESDFDDQDDELYEKKAYDDLESWEQEDDAEDEEVDLEAEEFDAVYSEPDEDDEPRAAVQDDEHIDDTDDGWDDDTEVEQVPEESAPRRWLKWAGSKFSGKGPASEEPIRERDFHGIERAEPVLHLDDLDEDLSPAPVAAPAPEPRRSKEPLDKSRQAQLFAEEEEDEVEEVLEKEEFADEQYEDERYEIEHAQETARAQAPRAQAKAKPAEASVPQDYSEVLVINVVAKPDREFYGIDLLPALLASGLRFGDMNIFHRHFDQDPSSPVLFSVANMVNPGTFDLNQINDFATRGVCFFMTLPNVATSMQAFDRMLDSAQQLRIALDGDLKDDNRSVMTAQTIEHYRQRVRDFDLRQLRQPK